MSRQNPYRPNEPPPPPGYDLGHAVIPNRVERNKTRIYGLLDQVGVMMNDIEQSSHLDQKRIYSNEVQSSMGNLALRMQDRLEHQTYNDAHMYDDVGNYTFDNDGRMFLNGIEIITENQIPLNVTQQEINTPQAPVYSSGAQTIRNTTMANINDYIGTTSNTSAPAVMAQQPTTTITFVDLQNANKPVVEKLDIACKILGMIFQSEKEMEQTLADLPVNLASQLATLVFPPQDEEPMETGDILPDINPQAGLRAYIGGGMTEDATTLPEQTNNVATAPAPKKKMRPKK